MKPAPSEIKILNYNPYEHETSSDDGPSVERRASKEQKKHAQLCVALGPLQAKVNHISQERLIQSQAAHLPLWIIYTSFAELFTSV